MFHSFLVEKSLKFSPLAPRCQFPLFFSKFERVHRHNSKHPFPAQKIGQHDVIVQIYVSRYPVNYTKPGADLPPLHAVGLTHKIDAGSSEPGLNERYEIAKDLIENGADVNTRCHARFTPLHVAVEEMDLEFS